MRALLAGARRKEAELIAFARRLVLAESPSGEKSAVDACMALAADRAKQLGARVRIHRQRQFSNLLEARFGPRTKSARQQNDPNLKPILLLGHLDTVWPLGTLRTMPARIREGKLLGPGAFDMKAGVAMAFSALEILLEAELVGPKAGREIILLLVSDEEVGSPVSRPVTEELARQCAAVYVLEPAQGLAYKTARKGMGAWRVEISGVAAHAGVDFDKGASSIRELARTIETVSAWTDSARGLTVNAGVVAGGTRSNVVAAQASGRNRRPLCAPRRGRAPGAPLRPPPRRRPTLHALGHRRHQPASDGAHRGNRSPLPEGARAGRRIRIRAA